MSIFSKTKNYIVAHKIISGIAIVLVLGGGYYAYTLLNPVKAKTTYVTSTAATGTITTSVSGSGQVSTSNQINLQFKASGDLTYLGVQNGQSVSAGQLIAQIDTTDAEQTIASAQSSLQSSQIALEKLQGTDASATTPQNKQDAENTLNQDYQTAYNDIANTFINLPTIATGLHDTLYDETFSSSQENIDYYTYTAQTYDKTATSYEDTLTASYTKAYNEYLANLNDYKTLTASSDDATIDAMLKETAQTTQDLSQAIKDSTTLIQFYETTLDTYNIKPNTGADTALSTLNTYLGEVNSSNSTLLSIQSTLANDEEAISNSDLDLQSAQLDVQNQQTALANAKTDLADYYIYAPFDGVIGNVGVTEYESVGSGTTVATLITNQKIANITLNEIDVSKIQAGQNAVLTFDAIPNLTIAGTVASINPIGTVSQGVVTYTVQIAFDTQNTAIKSGMSVDVNIITAVKQNVIVVPNAAVKTQGTVKYVQVLVNNQPVQKIVTVGLSDDTNTEIVSGVSAGDKVITQTITSVAKTSATSSSSTSLIPGLGGGGAGGFRGAGGGGGGFTRTGG